MHTNHNEASELLVELEQSETKIWNALVQGDWQADKDALGDCFLGVYPDGFASKSDHYQQLADGPTVESFALSSLRVLPLGKDHAVLSYRADFVRVEQSSPEAMYVSSIWRRRNSGWVNVFSQDTPALPEN